MDVEINRLLLDVTTDQVLVIDNKGTVVRANRKALAGDLLTAKNVVGKKISAKVLHEDFYELFSKKITATIKDHRKRSFTWRSGSGAQLKCKLVPLVRKQKMVGCVLFACKLPRTQLNEKQPLVIVDVNGNVCDAGSRCAYLIDPKSTSAASTGGHYAVSDLLDVIEVFRNERKETPGVKADGVRCVIARAAQTKEALLAQKDLASINLQLQELIEDRTRDLQYLIEQLQTKTEHLENISAVIPGCIIVYDSSIDKVEFLRNNLDLNLDASAYNRKFDIEAARQIVHPDDLVKITNLLSPDTGLPGDLEVRLQFRNASYRWVHIKMRKYKPTDVNDTRVLAVLFDIENIVQVEDRLRKNEQMLEHAQRVARMGSWQWNVSTGDLIWSAEIYRIFEQDPEKFQCSYSNFLATIHPADRLMVETAVQQCLNGNQPYNILHRIIVGDNRIKYVREIGEVEYNGDQVPVKMIGTVQDVTGQVETEHKLSRAFTTIENSLNAVFNCDVDGRVTYANPAAARMWGYSSVQEMMNEKPYAGNYWAPGPGEPDSTAIIEEIVNRGSYTMDHRIGLKKNGDLFYGLFTGSAIRTMTGEISGLAASCFDVSDRKHYEEMLRKSVSEKELLLKEIHHRVKNNLQIISGLLQLQLLRATSPECEASLIDGRERIQAIALVHEKLYSSNSLAAINFGEYLRDLAMSILAMKPVSKIDIDYDTDTFGLSIEKAVPLGLISNELITNSLKHGFRERFEGNIRVELKLHASVVSMIIADDGLGCDPTVLQHSENIGYKLVTSLARQLGGTVDVHTAPGKGMRTTISFPVS